MITMYEEDKNLANDILNRHYYQFFKQGKDFKTLEIFLLGACRSNCEYCYLKQHLNELYPIKLHNYDTITYNFQLILNWYVDNNFRSPIEIFSGEWLTTPLAPKIFDIIYNTFKNQPEEKRPVRILCADNMQFLKDDRATLLLENNIDRLNSINIPFILSCSIDGKYCDSGRTQNTDDFYNKLKTMIDKYHWLLHPMISAQNIKNWIPNFQWIEQTFGKEVLYKSTYLEVRNEEWTEESMNELLRFCDFLIDKVYLDLNESKDELFKYIFGIQNSNENDIMSYNPIRIITHNLTSNNDYISCSFGHALTIRAADLKVGPCHRTFYPDLELGYFDVKDNKIIDFIPTNVSFLAGKQYIKHSCLPICEHCGYVGVCPGFCFGASYEEYGNMFVPQKEVCEMYRSKYLFIFYKLKTMGILEDTSYLEKYLSGENLRYYTDLIFSSLKEAKLL